MHVVVLDPMLPAMSGIEICEWLRREGNDVPILMLTGPTNASESSRADIRAGALFGDIIGDYFLVRRNGVDPVRLNGI